MKRYLFASLLAAAAGMTTTSCQQSELAEQQENTQDQMATYRTKVRLIMPGLSGAKTRAAEDAQGTELDGFAPGTLEENRIYLENTYFEFYDENKKRMGSAQVIGNLLNPTLNEEGAIAYTTTVDLQANVQPYYMVVLTNVSPKVRGVINTLELGEFEGGSEQSLKKPLVVPVEANKTIKDDVNENLIHSAASPGFLMTNSTHYHGSEIQVEVAVHDYVQKVTENAANVNQNAVDVYIERMVAKAEVNVNIDPDNAATVATIDDATKAATYPGGIWKLPVQETADVTNFGVTSQLAVGLRGWGLSGVNKSVTPLKAIGSRTTPLYTQWENMGINWNSADYHRTYWAVDGNYGAGNYPTNADFVQNNLDGTYPLYYERLNKIAGRKFSEDNPEYCLENTAEATMYDNKSAITHVLVSAAIIDPTDPTAVSATADPVTGSKSVFRYNGVFFTAKQFRAYILKYIKARSITVMDKDGTHLDAAAVEALTPDIFKLTDPGDVDCRDRADVKNPTITCANYTIGTVTAGQDLRKYIFGEPTVWIYPGGSAYYTIPIKHFQTAKDGAGNKLTGYYGVVRNHWYKVNVTDITGFPNPASPTKPIIPEVTEDDEYKLSANINVLSWGVKNQNASLGGNDQWD